ncbi:hypothetical protein [Pseudoalteromonas sp. T1lg88]|uniref:hypothetical protein n=1 Tax=Pseudoalteromonas sp. T1lg88 TaxID=2077104 RepID=UPI00131A2992|nr:hypothetical protein [Pseudoalteromonas sp. T1lg88]
MRTIIVAIVTLLLVTGCSTSPLCSTACISEHESTFNGEKEVLMTPGFVYRSNEGISGSDLRIGAYWSSSLEGSSIILIVLPHKDIPPPTGSKLSFNINGNIKSYPSVKKENIPNFNPSTQSRTYFNPNVIAQMNVQYFMVTEEFLNSILDARDVRVRIDLENTYLEGVFSHNSAVAAKSGLIEFSKKLTLAQKQS